MKNFTRRQAIAAVALGTAVSVSQSPAIANDDKDEELRQLLRWYPKGSGQEWDAAESLWLRKLIVELKEIKRGVTRAELDRKLVSDGPTRSRKAHRYQHPRCPFVKLDVFFDVADGNATSTKRSEDKVIRIEGPCLDLSSNFERW